MSAGTHDMTNARPRFAGLWARLGLRGDPGPVFDALARAYAEPHRAYHNTDHILDGLRQLDLERDVARRPDEVEFALWFHDAVYDPRAADNEERSAAWAEETLAAAGAPPDVRERVASLVLATKHESPPPSDAPDARLLADVDLSILGRDPATFDDFERRIRQEYAWVSEDEYRRARAAVLGRFLRRDPLYLTPGFRRRYEAAAKHNLTRRLASFGGPGILRDGADDGSA